VPQRLHETTNFQPFSGQNSRELVAGHATWQAWYHGVGNNGPSGRRIASGADPEIGRLAANFVPTDCCNGQVEPFSVICETCRARLKVRSATAIGEIHACPRCGSMVQIASPPGWISVSASESETVIPVAVTHATVSPVIEATSSAPMPFAQVPSPTEEAADAFAEAAARALHTVAPANPPAETVPSIAPTSYLAGGVPNWLLGSGVVAAVVVVSGLGLAMLRGGPPEEVAAASHPVAKETDVAHATTPTADHEPRVHTDENSPLSDNASVRLAQKPPFESDSEADSATDDPSSADEAVPASDSVDSVVKSPTESDQTANVSPDADPNSPPPEAVTVEEPQRPSVLRFDPLDFDPSQLSLNSASVGDQGETSASVPPAESGDSDSPVNEPESDANDVNIPAMPAESPSVTVQLGPIARIEANPAQVARQFALRIESLSAAGMSLERFTAFIADLARVPITIDPTALALAGVSPRTVVAVQTSGVTLDQLARDVLAKQRLELVDRDGQMTISLAKAGERSDKRYDVSDLLSPGATDVAEVAQIVERFVAPKSWQAGKGTITTDSTKLRVDHSKAVHHELLIFLERWRLVRRLKQRSQYPAKLLSIEPPYQQVLSKLGDHTTFTFLPWTRLDEVFRHWEQSTGLTILVDWASLAEVELTPSAPISCSAIDQSWADALTEIFEPFGLAWWAVDSETIQITTQVALNRIERVEFYAIPQDLRQQFDSSAAFIESLRSELRQHTGDDAAHSQPELHVDVPSSRLLVRGTPVVHRYLAERLTSLVDN
jgi:hypothetical protein